MMRELLLAFVIALVVGSIINGWPKNKPNEQRSEVNSSVSLNSSTNSEDAGRKDFPDFASFLSVDSNNFENEVLKNEKPVLVECYVPNNSACDQMLPLVSAVAKAHEGGLIMAKLNVMDNLIIAHRYGVGTVPCFLLFNKGSLASKMNGVMPQHRLEAMLATVQQSASASGQSIQ